MTRAIGIVLALTCAVSSGAASAQDSVGEAMCAMIRAVEADNMPGSLDSAISRGRASGPVRARFTLEANAVYVILAAVEGTAQPTLSVTGLPPLGEPSTAPGRVALDFSAPRAARITVTLGAPRGARYAVGLWRLGRARRNELGTRTQFRAVGAGSGLGNFLGSGGGSGGGVGGRPSAPPPTLPSCIGSRTARAPRR